jgi:hypothetical protein
MAEEPELGLHMLLATAEFESASTSETSLSSDEGTRFRKTDEEESDIEKGGNAPLRSQQVSKINSLHFFTWTIVNTLATIGIVGEQSRM